MTWISGFFENLEGVAGIAPHFRRAMVSQSRERAANQCIAPLFATVPRIPWIFKVKPLWTDVTYLALMETELMAPALLCANHGRQQ